MPLSVSGRTSVHFECNRYTFVHRYTAIVLNPADGRADPVFDGVGRAGFKNRGMRFYWPKLLALFVFYCFPFFFLYIGWYWGADFCGLIRGKSFSPCLALPFFFNNNNNNNKPEILNLLETLSSFVFVSSHWRRDAGTFVVLISFPYWSILCAWLLMRSKEVQNFKK